MAQPVVNLQNSTLLNQNVGITIETRFSTVKQRNPYQNNPPTAGLYAAYERVKGRFRGKKLYRWDYGQKTYLFDPRTGPQNVPTNQADEYVVDVFFIRDITSYDTNQDVLNYPLFGPQDMYDYLSVAIQALYPFVLNYIRTSRMIIAIPRIRADIQRINGVVVHPFTIDRNLYVFNTILVPIQRRDLNDDTFPPIAIYSVYNFTAAHAGSNRAEYLYGFRFVFIIPPINGVYDQGGCSGNSKYRIKQTIPFKKGKLQVQTEPSLKMDFNCAIRSIWTGINRWIAKNIGFTCGVREKCKTIRKNMGLTSDQMISFVELIHLMDYFNRHIVKWKGQFDRNKLGLRLYGYSMIDYEMICLASSFPADVDIYPGYTKKPSRGRFWIRLWYMEFNHYSIINTIQFKLDFCKKCRVKREFKHVCNEEWAKHRNAFLKRTGRTYCKSIVGDGKRIKTVLYGKKFTQEIEKLPEFYYEHVGILDLETYVKDPDPGEVHQLHTPYAAGWRHKEKFYCFIGEDCILQWYEFIKNTEDILYVATFNGFLYDFYLMLNYLLKQSEEVDVNIDRGRIMGMKIGPNIRTFDLKAHLPGSLRSNCDSFKAPPEFRKLEFAYPLIKKMSDVSIYQKSVPITADVIQETLKYIRVTMYPKKEDWLKADIELIRNNCMDLFEGMANTEDYLTYDLDYMRKTIEEAKFKYEDYHGQVFKPSSIGWEEYLEMDCKATDWILRAYQTGIADLFNKDGKCPLLLDFCTGSSLAYGMWAQSLRDIPGVVENGIEIQDDFYKYQWIVGSMYGGTVTTHTKDYKSPDHDKHHKDIDHYLIPVDISSLYTAGMCGYERSDGKGGFEKTEPLYPLGASEWSYSGEDDFNAGKLGVYLVDVIPPSNQITPVLSRKRLDFDESKLGTEEFYKYTKSGLKRTLLPWTGLYTNVDIRHAQLYGYQFVFHEKALVWEKSVKGLFGILENVYNKKLEQDEFNKNNDERFNANLRQSLKNELNFTYGSQAQQPSRSKKIIVRDSVQLMKLTQSGKVVSMSLFKTKKGPVMICKYVNDKFVNTKSTQNGTFILSYSKEAYYTQLWSMKRMVDENGIRKLCDPYDLSYGDTDSAFIPVQNFLKMQIRVGKGQFVDEAKGGKIVRLQVACPKAYRYTIVKPDDTRYTIAKWKGAPDKASYLKDGKPTTKIDLKKGPMFDQKVEIGFNNDFKRELGEKAGNQFATIRTIFSTRTLDPYAPKQVKWNTMMQCWIPFGFDVKTVDPDHIKKWGGPYGVNVDAVTYPIVDDDDIKMEEEKEDDSEWRKTMKEVFEYFFAEENEEQKADEEYIVEELGQSFESEPKRLKLNNGEYARSYKEWSKQEKTPPLDG